MLEIYADRCKDGLFFKGYTINKIKTFIKGKMDQYEEWYLTAREAVQYGLMDAVLGDTGYETIKDIIHYEE
jgi:ATP-dependent protease ClpP protease subunit